MYQPRQKSRRAGKTETEGRYVDFLSRFSVELRVHCLERRNETKGLDTMLIGAAIAGLLIVSLFFEMLSSSPKQVEEREVTPPTVK